MIRVAATEERSAIDRVGEAAPYKAAFIASFLGWTLDAFDFWLVALCITAIAKEFGRSDAAIVLSITLTLVFRPVGAFVFGLLADRYGRRGPLMIDLVFFAVIEMLTGLASSYTIFLVLRALFGIGMGGEWGIGASLAMEKAPPARRGMLSGLLQAGYAFGYLLAATCYFFVFPRWGWRPLFFIGGMPALLAIFVRLRVTESEVWARTRHPDWRSLAAGVRAQWRLFVTLTLLMTAMNLVSHGTQDLYPTFLERDWGFGPRARSALTAVTMIGAVIGGITFGAFSDRVGRRRSIVIALAAAILLIPLWLHAPTIPLLVVGGVAMQFFVQGAWGVIPAHITELSPDAVRGFLPGFSYQCGVMLGSALPYGEALLAARTSYATAVSLTTVIVCTVAAGAVWLIRERRGIVFGLRPAYTI